MTRQTRITLLCLLIIMLPIIVYLQAIIDPQRAQFQPGRGVASVVTEVGSTPIVLPTQFIFGTVIGLREVVAGMLWIRANDFFHTGDYEPIIPLTRMITWLDPHQLTVYSVGAWHLAYNFVDIAERADRRYLIPGMAFLEEGIRNNPTFWDLYFEMGFTMYFNKVIDYNQAAVWLRKAQERGAPGRVQRTLAHALDKAGRVEECIAQWRYCIRDAERRLRKNPNDRDAQYDLAVSKRNLDGVLIHQEDRKDIAKRPVDIVFEAKFERLGPKRFRISGYTNLPDGARIDVTLADKGYKEPVLKEFTWEVDPRVTLLYDIGLHGMLVQNGRFERQFDLSRDPKQYPLVSPEYELALTFTPLGAPDEVLDVVGWRGEAMRAKKYLDTSIEGVRRIRKVIILKREDII